MYQAFLADVVALLQVARRTAARKVNSVMTVTYWLIGKRLVEEEQGGHVRAEYGQALLRRLAADLTARFGRGFSERNLEQMRLFFTAWPISQTASAKSARLSDATSPPALEHSKRFPLSWSHYVRLLSLKDAAARRFYDEQALRGGWTIRQLDRQISTRFYERAMASDDLPAMLRRGAAAKPEDAVTPDEEARDPYLLEFLNLKDEYSESDLEDALVRRLEEFLLEAGGDLTFVGRQRRLRIGDQWYRVDLVFYHRRLRCLVLVDLKTGRFSPADAGQMHLYLNYAREHWTLPGERPPVGLILCAQRDDAVARYALDGLPNPVAAAEYRTALPDERALGEAVRRMRRELETRRAARPAREGDA
jgi:predicted nuclease of restriction endonuclease-like (RecB) superfamily